MEFSNINSDEGHYIIPIGQEHLDRPESLAGERNIYGILENIPKFRNVGRY